MSPVCPMCPVCVTGDAVDCDQEVVRQRGVRAVSQSKWRSLGKDLNQRFELSGACLVHVWCMFGACLVHVWCMFGACLAHVLVHGWYMAGA